MFVSSVIGNMPGGFADLQSAVRHESVKRDSWMNTVVIDVRHAVWAVEYHVQNVLQFQSLGMLCARLPTLAASPPGGFLFGTPTVGVDGCWPSRELMLLFRLGRVTSQVR